MITCNFSRNSQYSNTLEQKKLGGKKEKGKKTETVRCTAQLQNNGIKNRWKF